MPAVRKTIAFDAAAFGLIGALVMLAFSADRVSADETLEPQPLQIPASARGLNTPPYRTNASPPSDGPLEAPVANEATGERPASFEARVPEDHAIVPWTDASRAAEKEALPGKSDLSGQVLKPKQSPAQKDSATLALRRSNGEGKNASPRSTGTDFGTMFASLFLVLGLFFLAAWMLKRGMPKGSSLLPSEVVEVLGRAPLGGKQQVHLLRIGNKMLLVAISAGGAETLTEITDPLEVDRLAGLCQQQSPHSSTNAFKQIFQQFARRGDSELLDDSLAIPGTTGNREVLHG
jgi:flagellar protein FliO/FliZ